MATDDISAKHKMSINKQKIYRTQVVCKSPSGAPEHMGTRGHVPTIFWGKALKRSYF